MSQVWIGGGKVVLPDAVRDGGSVLIGADGRIAALDVACPAEARAVDAHGGWILPGFIDIHVHGGGGADFMDDSDAAFRTALRTHFRHGTTAIVPTTMTCPDPQLEASLARWARLAHESGGADEPEVLGFHLEGPFFPSAAKGAQPVSEERWPTEEYLERILAVAEGRIIRWDEAPELPNTDVFARVMRRHGVVASVAHTRATAEEAAAAFAMGFSHVTHLYSATTTFHKRDGFVHAGVLEAAYLDDAVTIELIMDGRHMPKECLQLALRLKGADNICLITDAMRAAGTDAKTSVLGPLNGGTPVVIKDNVAQLPDFSSYAGSIGTMDRALRVAHLRYGIPIIEVSRMLSLTPARVCGIADRKGSLEPGKDGDVVVLTPDFEVSEVIRSRV